MQIESTYPILWVLPLAALAVFVVWLLYFRQQQESVLSKPIRILVGITRVLTFIILGLLIISPWFKTLVERQEKPWLLLALDNSVSMTSAGNILIKQQETESLTNEIRNAAENKFQVRVIRFSEQVEESDRCDFSGLMTDPSELFRYLRKFYRNHELNHVVLLTDGVSTRGTSFKQASSQFPYPLTIIGSGDSTRYPDVRIEEAVCNEWVRASGSFPVRIYFNSGDYEGSFRIKLQDTQKVLAVDTIHTWNQEASYAEFTVKAPAKGVMHLEAIIEPEEPDRNTDNNVKRFDVKIIEQDAAVLCLYESPHPDINALKQAIGENGSVTLKIVQAGDYLEPIQDFDLVILHGLPSANHPMADLMKLIADKNIPVLSIISKTMQPELLNKADLGLTIHNFRRSAESAKGVLSPDFPLFSMPADFRSHLDSWPPLELSFESYIPDAASTPLFKQKILNLELPDPLVVFTQANGTRNCFICGEGIWLWRLYEFLEFQDQGYFDDWLSKTIQFLMTDESKERFRIEWPEDLFSFSNIRVNAHLLNQSLEPVNSPDVKLTITDSVGRKVEYQMGKVNDYYEINISGFEPGTYAYRAETLLGDEVFSKEGILQMKVRPTEQHMPSADFESLEHIATATGGHFFFPGQERDLVKLISDTEPSVSVAKQQYRWNDLIDFKWLLPFLIILLGLEWFLRRWYGIR